MRWNRWKILTAACAAAVLAAQSVVYAAQITPIGESGVYTAESGEAAGEAVVLEVGPGGSETGSGEAAGAQPGQTSSAGEAGADVQAGQSPAAGSGVETGQSPSGSGGAASVSPAESSAAVTTAAGSEASSDAVSGPAAGTSEGQTATAASIEAAVAAASMAKPQIASEGAVLLDAATGAVLYSQNGETQYYPASITKLMTALLVAERCSLDDTVTFSATATTGLEAGAVSLNLTEGDTLTVRQCLYALLLKSANEVGNALAEHVAGSNEAFAALMNEKAAALGCTNTHFTNPHGLNDASHLTTPHDMALIARAAFANETVKTVASTRTYTLPATKNNPSGISLTMGHKMLNPSDSRYYEGIIGGKTGYTSKAGNTLVTVAERDGVRLVAVVMKSKSTHYTDTKALLDYGYALAAAGVL